MEARKCDRCGKYYDKPDATDSEFLVKRYNPKSRSRDAVVDLCGVCTRKLEYFLKNARLTVDMKGETNA